MAGKPGRSGRIGRYKELNILEILKLSETTVRACLKDESVPIEKRADLGMRFITKYMPDKVEVSGKVVTLSIDSTLASRMMNMMENHRKVDEISSDAIEIIATETQDIVGQDARKEESSKEIDNASQYHTRSDL